MVIIWIVSLIFSLFISLCIIMSAVHLNHIREDIRKLTFIIEDHLYDEEKE